MNNKFFLFVLAVTTVILIFVINFPKSSFFNRQTNPTPIITPTQNLINYQASVLISAPDENFFIEYETTNKRIYQPFSILEEALEKNNISFETEKYDFGVFVKSINGIESTNEKAWIYFVNGESGQVAADKLELNTGDLVEWKYITPSE